LKNENTNSNLWLDKKKTRADPPAPTSGADTVKQSSKIIAKINLPGGLDKSQLVTVLGAINSPIIALVILVFSLLWRAQIASAAATTGLEKKEIQGLPSMRFIASTLLTQNEMIKPLLAGFGILRLAYFFAEEYRPLPVQDRQQFLSDKITDLLNTPGTSKILQPYQVATIDEAYMSARGYMAQIRGIWQADTVFNPGLILKGIFLSSFNFENFVDAFIAFTKVMGFEESYVLETVENHYWQHSGFTRDKDPVPARNEFFSFCITDTICPQPLIFPDGLNVTADSGSPNVLPLEIVFQRDGQWLLERRRTAETNYSPSAEDSKDPFLASAGEAIKAQKRRRKGGK